ncbi:MAG: hypothetical protein H8D56_12510 [Planctomycetes bacterium]|nr:hypothetical protein [Planctomycetota bacterium]
MGLIEDAKEAVRLVQKIDNMELYRKILDLQSEAIELIEKLKEKDRTITKLKTALSLKGKLICEHSAYWLKNEKNETVDGPFCTRCFDVERNPCRLVQKSTPRQGCETVQCPNCKVQFPNFMIADYLSKH